ncbi:MAG: ribosome maturation factor RimM [Mycobacteriales bacterium]
MELVVGRIGRPHGVRGEVSVDVRTDDPDRRYAPGVVLIADPSRRSLTVVRSRWHHGRLLVHFEGSDDRVAADGLRGQLLMVDSATAGETEPGEYWDHQLVGLSAMHVNGTRIGEVYEVIHLPGSELLAVRRDDGGEVLIPFVEAIVPTVDVAGGQVVVDPPEGLLEINDSAPTES